MAQAVEPPSGTRDFLADEVRRRKAAFDTISAVFERYGFDPLETPAFERLEVFAGKLGEEAASRPRLTGLRRLDRSRAHSRDPGSLRGRPARPGRGTDRAGGPGRHHAIGQRDPRTGLRTGVYLGSSGKLARQLKWAHDQPARTVLICGPDEQQTREVTVRDMESGEQTRVPLAEVGAYLHNRS